MLNHQIFQASAAKMMFPETAKIMVRISLLTVSLLLFVLAMAACNSGSVSLPSTGDAVEADQTSDTAAKPTAPPAEESTQADEEDAGETQTETDGATVAEPEPAAPPTAETAPTATPLPEPTAPPEPTAEPLFYNLPETVMQYASVLYASPNRDDPIIPVPVPEGEQVFIMGRNGTQTHLRVVWNTGVGWIPVSFTDYNGQQARLAALPIFEREPPACAIPVTTQFGLNSTWTSDLNQKIAVVVDLFRAKYGAFPKSALALKVNDFLIEDSRREIVEQGQFSLKDVVLSLPQNVQPSDVVGYQLNTDSDEPLTFMATIFSVPSSCQWDID